MEIAVSRYTSDENLTRSLVCLDDKFECYGLEDAFHEEKIFGKTRIPCGTYSIGLRNEGGLTKKYLQKFPNEHRGMLHILDVPNFEWIYIHTGNNYQHTDGCLLVGQGVAPGGSVMDSNYAYRNLYNKVVDAADEGRLTVTFVDMDR